MDRDAVVSHLLDQRGLILGYTRVIVRDAHTAEDIFQEVMILALEHHGELQDHGHANAWARKTAQYLALNEIRRRHRKNLSLDAGMDAGIFEALEPVWEAAAEKGTNARVEILQKCMERLTPNGRRLIHLRFVEELDCSALAQRLARPLNTVYVGLSRTYRALSECMENHLEAER
jgi:RNA polymerase sigma-70 factor, ECF subfamily